MIEYMVEHPYLYLLFLTIILVFISTITSRLVFSRKNLSVLIEASSLVRTSERFEIKNIFLALLLLFGTLTLTSIIVVLDHTFGDIREEIRLQKIHRMIEESFEVSSNQQPAIAYVKKHELQSFSRYHKLEDIELKVQIPRQDIINSIRLFGGFRIRQALSDNLVMVEKTFSNTDYGTYLNHKKTISVVSTQNSNNPILGHFSYTLSEHIPSNYISNDFYGSEHLQKKYRFDFEENDAYLQMKGVSSKPIGGFIQDLHEINETSELFVYISRSSENTYHDIHIMCGLLQEQSHETVCPDIQQFDAYFQQLKKKMNQVGFSITTKEIQFENTSHITNALSQNMQKPVLIILLSNKILLGKSDARYFQVMKELRDFLVALHV
jgi:hypothetical protein